MKKSKYTMVSVSAFIIVIVVATLMIINNKMKDDDGTSNEKSVNESQDIENDETGIETIDLDDYTILLRGSARPKNDEISVEEAAEIGVTALEEEYNIVVKNDVEMIFLDDVLTNTSTWSGHLNLSDSEKYEFLIDGKDGSLKYMKRNE